MSGDRTAGPGAGFALGGFDLAFVLCLASPEPFTPLFLPFKPQFPPPRFIPNSYFRPLTADCRPSPACSTPVFSFSYAPVRTVPQLVQREYFIFT